MPKKCQVAPVVPSSQQRLNKSQFLKKVSCMKPCWDHARLSSLVNALQCHTLIACIIKMTSKDEVTLSPQAASAGARGRLTWPDNQSWWNISQFRLQTDTCVASSYEALQDLGQHRKIYKYINI